MKRHAAWRAATFVACLLAVHAGMRARAHQGHPVIRAERTIKFEADGHQGLRVIVTVNYGAEEMLRIGRAADEDGDGRLVDAEVEQYMIAFGREVRRALPMRLDGERSGVAFGMTFYDPKGAIDLRPGTLEIEGTIDVPSGRHTLVVEDETPVDTFDRTDVIFTSTNEATLLASGTGDAPTEILPSFAYGPRTERERVQEFAMTFAMPVPRPGRMPRPNPVLEVLPGVVLGALALVAVALGRTVLAIRRRNAAKRTNH